MTSPASSHLELDARIAIRSLTAFTPLSLADAAKALDISRPTLSRIRSGKGTGRQDISGLHAGIIRELYTTPSGVACKCQLMELDLRLADLEVGGAAVSEDLLSMASKRLFELPRADHPALDAVDRLALASLEGQIALYNARAVATDEARWEIYRRAMLVLTAATELIMRQFALGGLAWESDRLLGLRILLNAFLAAWELDLLDGKGKELPNARKVARSLSEPGFLRKAREIARMIGDPRLSYQTAEAAAISGQYVAAGNLLADAIEIDGQDPAQPLSWHPTWLPIPVRDEPHFETAIDYIHSRYRFKHKES